jgi:hypothetical protein
MKPNFFILGAPKCGTTAMSEYLREHPNLFMSYPKEPKYFDSDLAFYRRWTPETYLDLFSAADPQKHLAAGEASVTYLYSRRAVGEILKFNPDAQFIVMLRDPLELVQSWHSQQVYTGQEDLVDFEQAWRAQSDRKSGGRIPFACHEVKMLFYSELGKLGEQVERLLAQAQRRKVLFILFDDFAADPKKSYEQVLAFLGLPLDGRKVFPRINEQKTVRWPWAQQVLHYGLGLGSKVKSALGMARFETGIFRGLMRLNSRNSKRAPIWGEFERELRDFFREDVAKLSGLLGRDLSAWTAGKKAGVD